MEEKESSTIEKEEFENTKQGRMKALLVRIGEKSATPLHKNIEILSKALSKDLYDQSDFILDILFQCIVHLTSKTGVYGTLVGFLNNHDPEFGKSVVKRVINDIRLSIAANDFARINILIRFSGELVKAKVIKDSDYFKFLNKIIGEFFNLKVDQAFSDFYFYCIVGILPYCGSYFLTNSAEDLADLLRKLTTYYDTRNKNKMIKYFSVFNDETEEFLDMFWKSLIASSEKEWICETVINTSSHFLEKFNENESHPFDVSFPENIDYDKTEKPQFCNLLKILNEENEQEKSDCSRDLKRAILFEYFSDTILYFEDNREECTKQLLKLADENNGHTLLVESVFSLMLQLPLTQSKLAYYGCVFIELFKAQPKVYPKIVGASVSTFFDNIDRMDLECRDRLVSWFSFHLSNFNFKWAWKNWAFVSSLPEPAPKRIFCENLLRSCIELSPNEMSFSGEEISAMLPQNMGPDFKFEIGEEKRKSELPEKSIEQRHKRFKEKESNGVSDPNENEETKDEDSETEEQMENNKGAAMEIEKDPVDEKAKKLVELFDRKEDAGAVLELLEVLKEERGEEKMFEMFFQCMLYSGSSSFSSLFRLFDKYKPVVLRLAPTINGQKAIVEAVFDFWRNCHLQLKVILQKLITYGFVQAKNLVEVLVSDKHLAFFFKPVYTTILTNLIDLFSQRLTALKQIFEKNPSTGERSEKERDNLMQKILITNEDRHAMLKIILNGLNRSVIYFLQNVVNYQQDELFKVLYNRLVMFLRKYKEAVADISEELKKNVFIPENDEYITNIAFREIVLA